MKEKRDGNVEELAQELESRIGRGEEDERKPVGGRKEESAGQGSGVGRKEESARQGSGVGRKGKSAGQGSGIGRSEETDEPEEIVPEDAREETFSGEEYPDDLWEDEYPEEDNDSVKPWMMAAAVAVVIVLAAIICAVLWHFTHLEQKGGEEDSRQSASVSAENSAAPEDASAPTPAAEVTASPEPAPTATPEPTATPVPATPTPAAPQTTMPPSTAAQEPVSGTTAMEFTQGDAQVTPKDVINLRSEPSTLNADNIVAQAKNGEVLNRTGVNEATGWTRLDYNGETLYAVSQYLTTDLNYKTPVRAADPNRVNTLDGRIILFTDCSDDITPKEYVNLRTEPSTSEGESTVRCQISNGEVVHRTGYSPDAGWSRVEYNGEVLYVVSSYMYSVQ